MNVFIQCAKHADTCRGMMRMTREISVVSCVIQTYAVVLSDASSANAFCVEHMLRAQVLAHGTAAAIGEPHHTFSCQCMIRLLLSLTKNSCKLSFLHARP